MEKQKQHKCPMCGRPHTILRTGLFYCESCKMSYDDEPEEIFDMRPEQNAMKKEEFERKRQNAHQRAHWQDKHIRKRKQ